MSEKALATRVVKLLKPLDAMRVENPCHPGTPDINYIGGWIELKQVDAWPKKETTPLRLPHFSKQQRIWLTRRWAKGGDAWVLLQVAKEYFLFEGPVAAKHLGEANRDNLYKIAYATFTSKELNDFLLGCLTEYT
jgi:hypothetical protein